METQYPQVLKLEVAGKSLSMFGAMGEGDFVEAECNLKGKIYNEKCYTSISCWKVAVKGVSNNTAQQPQQTRQEVGNTPPVLQQKAFVPIDEPLDDLPF